MTYVIAPIVEGHGDVAALPVLLRRIAPLLVVKRPVRFPRTKLLIRDELARAAKIAASNIPDQGGILLLLDADEDCAATLGPDLERQITSVIPNRKCRVALAVQEFEAWIVGGDESYGVENADSVGKLKERIRQRYGVYSETADQARLIATANMGLLEQRSRSFRHLRSVVREFESELV